MTCRAPTQPLNPLFDTWEVGRAIHVVHHTAFAPESVLILIQDAKINQLHNLKRMKQRGLHEYLPEMQAGYVSQACFFELQRFDGEDSASAANALGSFLRCLKTVIRRGNVVCSYHPKMGEVQLRSNEELNAWCAEFFPCAALVWSTLVWSSEKNGWERFGDRDFEAGTL